MAKTSPTKSKGIKIPVDSFAPYTKAKPVTINEAIPLIPDFETPSRKAQLAAIEKFKSPISNKKKMF